MRLNFWVSLVLFVGSTAFFVWWQFLRGDEPREPRGARPLRRRPKPEPVPKGPAMAIPRRRGRR
jgi:hypothetical protein